MPASKKGDTKKKSDNAGGLRWLLTYSDMITLLLALFIILYALSSTQTQKFESLALALQKQFGSSIIGQAPGPSIIPGSAGTQIPPTITPPISQTLNKLAEELQAAVDAAHLQHQVTIQVNPAGVRVSLQADLLFPSGLAILSPTARHLLETIGGVLNTVPNDIEIIGDTDSTPIRTSQYPSNWQLGANRSANVTDILASRVSPTRLIQVSFSKYEPIATNTTASGRQANRRVDILVLTRSLGTVLKDTGTIGVPLATPIS